MTVNVRPNGEIELVGDCGSDDAEALLRELALHRDAAVDWRACDTAHTAVIQVLLAAGVQPIGPPAGQFLRTIVEPLLRRR
jgi:hypothetical protein